MDKKCKEFQLLLMDIHYEEREMSEEVKKHLAECQDCRVYWQQLQEMDETLEVLDFEAEINYADIDNALVKQEKRETVIDLLKFALVALLYSIIIIVTFRQLDFRYFIYFQGFVYLVLPLLSVPLIYLCKRRGDNHG